MALNGAKVTVYRKYINDFLQATALGRTDWQNLTPAKIYLK